MGQGAFHDNYIPLSGIGSQLLASSVSFFDKGWRGWLGFDPGSRIGDFVANKGQSWVRLIISEMLGFIRVSFRGIGEGSSLIKKLPGALGAFGARRGLVIEGIGAILSRGW